MSEIKHKSKIQEKKSTKMTHKTADVYIEVMMGANDNGQIEMAMNWGGRKCDNDTDVANYIASIFTSILTSNDASDKQRHTVAVCNAIMGTIATITEQAVKEIANIKNAQC